MNHATRRSLAAFGLTAVLLALTTSAIADDKEEGFEPLFNGKDMSDFELVKAPPETWKVEDGIIRCTGKPNGYFATKESFKNYTLRLDFRFPEKPGNSGYLMNITGEHKVWPQCIEVQGHYNSVGMIFPAGGAKGPRPPFDADARKKAVKPHDEWNSLEIVVQDGAITSILNGTTVAASEPYELKEGKIGFQSEGAPIDFRNLRIKKTK